MVKQRLSGLNDDGSALEVAPIPIIPDDPFVTMDVEGLISQIGPQTTYTPGQRIYSNPNQVTGNYRVDLSKFEDYMQGEPVFTRSLFEEVSQLRRWILASGGKHNTTYTITRITIDDPHQVVWVPPEDFYPLEEVEKYEVHASMLNQVKLSPNYHLLPGSPVVKTAREYAKDSEYLYGREATLCPIVLDGRIVRANKDHLNPNVMSHWTHVLENISRSWNTSEAKSKLQALFKSAASASVPIHQIIAFGLGEFNDIYGHGSVAHLTQYFAVLSVAETLNSMHDTKIKLVFQDPCYAQKDKMLISSLPYDSTPCIVDNLEAFALIDKHTLVFGPYVPISVPLLQICADVGSPAGIFVDKIKVSEDQRRFNVYDRASPSVVRMLKEYVRLGLEDHVMDDELVEVTGAKKAHWARGVDAKSGYWARGMEVFLRLQKAEERYV